MPIELPRRLARFNRVVTNPIQGLYAWALPPWAVICHRGRRSGRAYRTPVVAVRRGGKLAVAILYGEQSDWVRNLLAGGGEVVLAGRTYPLLSPRLVSTADGARVPAAARNLLRLTEKVLVADLGQPTPGFGRGPSAD